MKFLKFRKVKYLIATFVFAIASCHAMFHDAMELDLVLCDHMALTLRSSLFLSLILHVFFSFFRQ